MYSYAQLSDCDLGWFRIGGAGLGNLLLPWARSIVYAKNRAVTPLFPTWPQLKIGPLMRGERDLRAYSGLFSRTDDYGTHIEKLLALCRAEKIPEREVCEHGQFARDRTSMVVFRGIGGYFKYIRKDHDYVRNCLLRMTRERHKKGLRRDESGVIGVHVRLGDFVEPQSRQELLSGPGIYRLPMTWYKEKINSLRAAVGSSVEVNIFSDGDDTELQPLLMLDNVQRQYYGSSIADLLALSMVDVLIASASTFSMWASYLGRMPAIWYPTQLPHRLYYNEAAAELESGEDEELPDTFQASVVESL